MIWQGLINKSWVGSEHDEWFDITEVQYYIDYILYTVAIITAPYPEVCIRQVKSSKSRIQVMIYHKNHPELDNVWLTSDERLTYFSKARERIVGKVKVEEYPSVQGPQSCEEDLVVWERYPIRTERP